MRITGLRTNYQKNPIGIDLSDLTFTWQVEESAGDKQTHSCFLVAGDPGFRTILFDSDRDDPEYSGILPSYAYTPELKAVPAKKYYWKISVTDDAGEFAESEVQTFEGGHGSVWTGVWISPSIDSSLHVIMRKVFRVTGKELAELKSARLYICGLGLYEAYLNGNKTGDQFLTPYFTDYRYWAQYQTYDIADFLKEGENTLDVWLGNGWFKGRYGDIAYGQIQNYFGDRFAMIVDVMMQGENGSMRTVGSDASWSCMLSPVCTSNLYDGEIYDSRRETRYRKPSARQICSVNEVKAPVPSLSPMIGLPVIQHEVHEPARLITTPRQETVLDFGQEVTGWVEFEANVPLGIHILLEYGEVLQGGNFYRDNLLSAKARFEYIGDGRGKRTIRPHFTYYGFRYVKISGMNVTEENQRNFHFRAVSLYSDLEEIGSIGTGNAKVNRLIANTKWSEKDNFLDIPSDCPQRDERLGWTGDAEIFSATASYHMETPQFFRKYLKDMAFEQEEKNGAVPYVVPDILTIGREKMGEPPLDISGNEWGEAGSAVWGDAATIIPWQSYLHFGNKKTLATEYTNMKQWVDFIHMMDETYCNGNRLWTCGFHFGDWLSLDVESDATGMINRQGGTDLYYISSVFYMYSALLTSRAAVVLGKKKDAKFYGNLSKEIRRAIRKKYVTGKGTLSIHTQTAYVLAIYFGLFEDEEAIRIGGDRLVEILHEFHDHLSTGFVGTAYLCEALTASGHDREAYTLLLNEDYPGWLYEVNLGSTTIWERWNSLLPDGRISSTGMNSLNHYAYGSICQWIYERVCGLRLTERGIHEQPIFENGCGEGENTDYEGGIAGCTMIIAPHPDRRLGKAEAVVRFAGGRYISGWKYAEDGKSIQYEFSVPFDRKAKFHPAGANAWKSVTINGEVVDRKKLENMVFHKGTYVVKAILSRK